VDRRGFLVGSAAALAAPRAFAASLGGMHVALVTADLEAQVVAFELSTGRRVRVIPTMPLPRAIERVGTTAVVAHSEVGVVTLIDAHSLRVRKVVRGFGEPRYAAASRDGRYAYLTDSGRGEVAVLDVDAGRVIARVEVGGPARHVALDPSGRRLWTALGMKAAEVAIVDVTRPAHPRLLRRFRPPWLAHDLGFAPAGDRIWVTSGAVRELALYDRRTGRVMARLPAGAPPQHLTFLGSRAYVTSGDDGTLEVRSASTGARLRTTRIPTGSFNVQHADGAVLTPSLSHGTLCVADRGGRLVRRVQAARSSHDACFVVAR
jgi:DNA-binding beta-propeller fold protein YncE